MNKGIRRLFIILMFALFFSKGTVFASDIPIITNFTATPGTEAIKGTTVTLQGTADNIESMTLQFRYLIYDGATWAVLSEGSTLESYNWQTAQTGKFLLCFQIIRNEQQYNQFMFYSVVDSYARISGIETKAVADTIQIIPKIETNDSNLLYTYQIYDVQNNVWSTLNSDTTQSSCNWMPIEGGNYWINVSIKDKHNRTYSYNIGYYIAGASINAFSADKGYPQAKGTSISLSGTVNNQLNQKLQYSYLVYDGSHWEEISKSATLEAVTWKPQSMGNYLLCFQIYDEIGRVVEQKFIGYTISALSINVGNIKVENTSGSIRTLSSTFITNDAGAEYQWECYNIATKTWQTIREWDKENATTWKPQKAGIYLINVKGRTRDGDIDQKAMGYLVNGIEITDFKTSVASPQTINTSIQLTGNVKNPLDETLTYRYLEYDGVKWKELYSGDELIPLEWNPISGQYLLCLQVIDSNKNQYNKFCGYTINPYITNLYGINIYSPDRKTFYIQANLSTNDKNLTYKYMFYDLQLGVWNVLGEGKQTNTYWQPLKSGNYWIHVEVLGSDGKKYTKTVGEKINGFPIINFTADKSSPQKTNTTITFFGTCKNMLSEKLTYQYLVYNGTKWELISSKNEPHACNWQSGAEGNYLMCYQIINESNIINQSFMGFKISNRVDFADRLATFNTYSTNTSNGTYNMMKALGIFNQVVIYPGQTLSFNGTTGYCGQAAGYLQAGVVGGIGYGGGICQASTTLYGAATRAGLTTVQRRNHSVASTYVPAGQDAMVDYGSSDLVIRNDFDFPVKIVTYTSGRYLFADIYGNQPNSYDNIEVYSWTTGTYSAAAMRVYYKNGYEVGRQDLPSSYYKSAVR